MPRVSHVSDLLSVSRGSCTFDASLGIKQKRQIRERERERVGTKCPAGNDSMRLEHHHLNGERQLHVQTGRARFGLGNLRQGTLTDADGMRAHGELPIQTNNAWLVKAYLHAALQTSRHDKIGQDRTGQDNPSLRENGSAIARHCTCCWLTLTICVDRRWLSLRMHRVLWNCREGAFSTQGWLVSSIAACKSVYKRLRSP